MAEAEYAYGVKAACPSLHRTLFGWLLPKEMP